MERAIQFLKGLDPLVMGLASLGLLLVCIVIVINSVQARRARKERDSAYDALPERSTPRRVEPVLNDAVAEASRVQTPIDETHFVAVPDPVAREERIDEDDISVHSSVEESVRAQETFSEPARQLEATPETAPHVVDTVQHHEAKVSPVPVDARVHSILRLNSSQGLSAETVGNIAAKAREHLPRSQLFGLVKGGADWVDVTVAPKQTLYSALAVAAPLASRAGAITESTLREWMSAVALIGQAQGADIVYAPVNDDAKRAIELDQFCSNIDAVASVNVLRADRSAIPGTRLRGTLEAEGFRLHPQGFFELPADDGEHVLYEARSIHGQPMSAESLRHDGVHGVELRLDVMRAPNAIQQFDLMRGLAKRLATRLEATVVDDRGHALTDATLAHTRAELETKIKAARSAGIEPGSALAMVLFAD